MKIYLRDLKADLVEYWKSFFSDSDEVQASHGEIFALNEPVDAIVSPANSFGFMDGGIDYVYSEFFGWEMQERLQQKIADEYDGELLVGQATTLRIKDFNKDSPIEFLISAPTMRVPMDVSKTVNAYLAFRAVLLECRKRPEIKSILCPGLGTAVGRMPSHACAAQMFAAYESFRDGKKPDRFTNLGRAYSLHKILVGQTPMLSSDLA